MQTFKELAEGSPYAGGNGDKDRLMIGFGLLSPGAPRDFIEPLFAQARQARAQVITTHSNAGPIFGCTYPLSLYVVSTILHFLLVSNVALKARIPRSDTLTFLSQQILGALRYWVIMICWDLM